MDGIGSCILYIDEIEKSLNRSAVSGQGDTGTSSRSFGTLLTWLSEHKTPVFVIGTSNNFTILPPEMIRKGRFDELFWLDLPSEADRASIFRVLLKRYGRDPAKFNLKFLAKESRGFTGAELEQVIVSVMFKCFSDKQREFSDMDLILEIQGTTPQSKTNEADIIRMRAEAEGKLRMAGNDGTVVSKRRTAEYRHMSEAPQPQAPNALNERFQRLFRDGKLVQLHVSKWSMATRLNREDLPLVANAVLPDFVKLGNKMLVSEEQLKKFAALENAARSYLRAHAHPFPIAQAHFVPHRTLTTVIEKLPRIPYEIPCTRRGFSPGV